MIYIICLKCYLITYVTDLGLLSAVKQSSSWCSITFRPSWGRLNGLQRWMCVFLPERRRRSKRKEKATERMIWHILPNESNQCSFIFFPDLKKKVMKRREGENWKENKIDGTEKEEKINKVEKRMDERASWFNQNLLDRPSRKSRQACLLDM